MRRESKTWLLIGLAVLIAVAAEMVTVVVWGFPMSHAMQGAAPIVVFAFGMVAGGLASHFWWPAYSRWPAQDKEIARLGSPEGAGPVTLRRHAAVLWLIHTGGKG